MPNLPPKVWLMSMDDVFWEQMRTTIVNAAEEIRTSALPNKIKELRLSALCELPGYLNVFLERYLIKSLVLTVCQKKVEFIMQATSQGALRDILKPPRPEWTGNGLCCRSQYYIPEEELLMWAYVSPNNNLKPEAYSRYMQLFEDFLGIPVASLLQDTGIPEIDLSL